LYNIQPKGWIEKHTNAEEHKVNTITQYNRNNKNPNVLGFSRV